MVDRFELTDKVALVIGGSNGLGREIALGFQAAGATSVLELVKRLENRWGRLSPNLPLSL
jgi:NAD(P)-dependent dehydrogenase (short-subunit alcohol dehydrogenase family)